MSSSQIPSARTKQGTGGDSRASVPRGMTLLELVIASAVFSIVLLVAYGAMQSMRNFTQTNTTQVDLQEEARHALEEMRNQLQTAGRFTDAPTTRTYPAIFKDNAYPPTTGANGYSTANKLPPPTKIPPVAPPGTLVNGGDPTLPSDEIIFKVPQMDASGLPVMVGNSIVWSIQEFGYFIVPDNSNPMEPKNNIEFRDSSRSQQQIDAHQPVHGSIVARYVDRMEIEDLPPGNQWLSSNTDPTLSSRQLRITLYLTRDLTPRDPSKPVDPHKARQLIIVSLSTIVDMRNTTQLY